MKTLILDNYDSFTYNLVHIIRQLGLDYEVHRNDRIDAREAARFDRFILSPGPGIPDESGNMPAIIAAHLGKIPMLGICLGHQAIAEHLGARLQNMDKVYHGLSTKVIQSQDSKIFEGVPKTFNAGRYHSWKVDKADLPPQIKVTAVDEAGDVMAFDVKGARAFGLQFHPESILTKDGARMIENFTGVII